VAARVRACCACTAIRRAVRNKAAMRPLAACPAPRLIALHDVTFVALISRASQVNDMMRAGPLDAYKAARARPAGKSLGPPSCRADDLARFNEAKLGKPSHVLEADSLAQFLVRLMGLHGLLEIFPWLQHIALVCSVYCCLHQADLQKAPVQASRTLAKMCELICRRNALRKR
jgi:hypothetical protein